MHIHTKSIIKDHMQKAPVGAGGHKCILESSSPGTLISEKIIL